MSRNESFNAQLLKALRKKLDWTQFDLAQRANLSVRVVAKAEAGRGVATRTLQYLVQALKEAGEVISVEDLRSDPRQKVQALLATFIELGNRTRARLHSLISRNVKVVMDGDPLTNPLAGTYQGIEELDELLHRVLDIFVRDGGTLGDLTQMRLTGHEVIAWGHEFIRVPEAPQSLPTFIMLRIEFCNGLISQIDCFYEATGLMSRLATWKKLYPNAAWTHYLDLTHFGSSHIVQSHLAR
jgi:transcriptional regulator with XRE-family HTH domain